MYKLKGDTVIKGDLCCRALYLFSEDNDPDYATKYAKAVDENACQALDKYTYEGDLVLDGDLYVTLDYKFKVLGSYKVSTVCPSLLFGASGGPSSISL
ncbi:hypothetical protein DSLPV1_221 [Dishui lake phycodnavirus 1]|uniref:hypothetical protein n=1 Tax=Dishui lake phycodnavirus 1 TaxID=2079134 RepID=UPI000CD683B3|nr:hypothetical protein C5Y57_gp177 [Dishui lake phycodnavirus 1]AUT19192.1 hypothetical protein DSLPV1_221 [Dishui lake phycodnavirus 1]